jgi:hypothetical protein
VDPNERADCAKDAACEHVAEFTGEGAVKIFLVDATPRHASNNNKEKDNKITRSRIRSPFRRAILQRANSEIQ